MCFLLWSALITILFQGRAVITTNEQHDNLQHKSPVPRSYIEHNELELGRSRSIFPSGQVCCKMQGTGGTSTQRKQARFLDKNHRHKDRHPCGPKRLMSWSSLRLGPALFDNSFLLSVL